MVPSGKVTIKTISLSSMERLASDTERNWGVSMAGMELCPSPVFSIWSNKARTVPMEYPGTRDGFASGLASLAYNGLARVIKNRHSAKGRSRNMGVSEKTKVVKRPILMGWA